MMKSMTRFGVAALLALAAVGFFSREASAQRYLAPKATAGPFAPPVVEQGPVGDIQLVSLQGVDYARNMKPTSNDLLIYNRANGQAWFVYNMGILYGSASYGPWAMLLQHECVVYAPMAPGLTLTATKIDDDLVDDVIGVNAAGQIFRYVRRGAPGC